MNEELFQTQIGEVQQIAKGKQAVVLCVDDEKAVLDTLEIQLGELLNKEIRKLGYNVQLEFAQSGEEALEIIEECRILNKPVAVIISDQVMPGMKGDELLIKAHELYERARKIMLTGQADVQDIAEVINKANLYRFIMKPWNKEDLQLTVKEALKSYYDEIEKKDQYRRLRAIYDSARAWISAKDIDYALKELAVQLESVTYADNILIFLKADEEELKKRFDEETLKKLKEDEKLMLAIEASEKPDVPGGITITFNPEKPLLKQLDKTKYPVDWIKRVVRTKKIEIRKDTTIITDKYLLSKSGDYSVLAVPMITPLNNELIGVVYLEEKGIADYFTEDIVELVDVLASISAVSIENAKMYEKLEKLLLEETKKVVGATSHRDEIIRIVSHDIRSPLTGIVELSQLLSDPEVASSTEQVVEFANLIKGSAQMTLKLANDILDLAKLEEGKVILHKTPVSVKELFEKIYATFKPNAISKDIDLIVSPDSDIKIEADESKLIQAIGNFVANAIKFTPQGGKVTLSAEKTTRDGTEYVMLKIQDTGIGIPEDQIDKIFEKFSSHQRSGTSGEKGTGLGLSIAKLLVEAHGGHIEVKSKEGQGTTFILYIPVQ